MVCRASVIEVSVLVLAAGWGGVLPALAGDGPPLSGPRVVEPGGGEALPEGMARSAKATLVVRDLDGSVQPLDRTPEEAAVDLLTLNDAARSKARAVFDRRAAAIDEITINNLDLFNKIGTANAAGKTLDQLSLGLDLWRKTEPLRERGSLRKQVKAGLPKDQGARFDALLDEYWDVVAEDGAGKVKADGKKQTRFGARIEGKLKAFGGEIERSFRRQLSSGDLVFQFAFAGVDLRPDQAERLHGQFSDAWERSQGDLSKEDFIGLFMSASSQLDNQQRPIFIENLARLQGGGLARYGAKGKPAKGKAPVTSAPASGPKP